MTSALRSALSLLVAAVLVGLLLAWSGVRPSEVWDALRALELRTFLLAFGIQLLIYPLRAARFRALLDDAGPRGMRALVPITAAHSLVAYLLPAKVGEASLLLYLRRGLGRSGAQGLALLLISRLLDFALVSGSLALVCVALALSGEYAGLTWLLPLGMALFLPALLFGGLALRGAGLTRLVMRVFGTLGLTRGAIGQRALNFAGRLETSLAAVSPRQLLAALLWTAPVWVCVYLFYAVLARGLGLTDLSWMEAVFGASLAVLSNLLPINAFAGFGTQDAGWVFGYTALGAGREVATQSALAFHLIYVLQIAVLGLIGHALVTGRSTNPPNGPRSEE